MVVGVVCGGGSVGLVVAERSMGLRSKTVEARSGIEDGQKSLPVPKMGEIDRNGGMGRRKWGNVGRQCRRPEIAGRSRKRGENEEWGNGSPEMGGEIFGRARCGVGKCLLRRENADF
jgi:hypothetical protein